MLLRNPDLGSASTSCSMQSVYHISLVIRRKFFLPKQCHKSRSILKDGSRSLELFRKGKIHNPAKFHMTDLVIWGHSIEGRTLSYSRINMVGLPLISHFRFLDFSKFPYLFMNSIANYSGTATNSHLSTTATSL